MALACITCAIHYNKMLSIVSLRGIRIKEVRINTTLSCICHGFTANDKFQVILLDLNQRLSYRLNKKAHYHCFVYKHARHNQNHDHCKPKHFSAYPVLPECSSSSHRIIRVYEGYRVSFKQNPASSSLCCYPSLRSCPVN